MSSRSSLLDAIREAAGTDHLQDSFAAAVASSPKTAAKVVDSLMAWAADPGPVPELGRTELRPFVDTTWTEIIARKARQGIASVGEVLNPVGDQVSLYDPAAERMLKLLLLYCHSVLIPVHHLSLIPRQLLIDGRGPVPGMVRFFSHLAPLIDAGVVIPVPDRMWPTESERVEGLTMLADGGAAKLRDRRDPLGPIPADVLAGISPENHDWYRNKRLRLACRSIVHGQAMLESIDDRGCLLMPGRRWVNLVNSAGVDARRLGGTIDENAIITELLAAPLPLLDNQSLSFNDICSLRGSDGFEQWRDGLAAALELPTSSSVVDWTEASGDIVEAANKLRADLKRHRVKEFARGTTAHFGVWGMGAAALAPLHLLVPPAAAVEAAVVASFATIEWFRFSKSNKRVQDSLAHHAALFEVPVPAA